MLDFTSIYVIYIQTDLKYVIREGIQGVKIKNDERSYKHMSRNVALSVCLPFFFLQKLSITLEIIKKKFESKFGLHILYASIPLI